MHKQLGEIFQGTKLRLLLAWYLVSFFLIFVAAELKNKIPLTLSMVLATFVLLAVFQSTQEIRAIALAGQLEQAPTLATATENVQEFVLDRTDALNLYVQIEAVAEAYPPNVSTQAVLTELAEWLNLPQHAARASATIAEHDPIHYCLGKETPDEKFFVSCP